MPQPVTDRNRGDVATILLGLFDAYQQMENDRLLAEGKKHGAPQSMEEVGAMLLRDQPFTDLRYATGPQEGEQYWSPDPGLNYVPDDIPLRPISPLVSLDPETGMLYATPPFASEGRSGINYADFAMQRGLAEQGFRDDIAVPKGGKKQAKPEKETPSSLLDEIARLLGLGDLR